MNEIESVEIQCPYCWESFEIAVDCSIVNQNYIEDCQVCCKPIDMTIDLSNEEEIKVMVRSENE